MNRIGPIGYLSYLVDFQTLKPIAQVGRSVNSPCRAPVGALPSSWYVAAYPDLMRCKQSSKSQVIFMQQSSGINGASLVDPALRAMFEARKRVFVDLLGWDVPVLDGTFEIDQFDTPSAAYLVLTGENCEHRASARLLRSDGPHILRDLFPQLCTGPVPQDEAFREITRFCIDPTLPRADRRGVRNQLVSALADFAISEGISGYSAVAPVPWFRQIAQFGWRCQQLGPCVPINGQQLVALRIDIDQDTRAQLANAGIYCRNPQPEAYGGMELAA
ncbi:acyl-homoserine-lactone synthase [Qipengyuania flava]|uniref:acyl-homoserine-lactone synthase n=1 Tax=Qipengyuania flava TaxID=192812 RepID=UPI002AA56A78